MALLGDLARRLQNYLPRAKTLSYLPFLSPAKAPFPPGSSALQTTPGPPLCIPAVSCHLSTIPNLDGCCINDPSGHFLHNNHKYIMHRNTNLHLHHIQRTRNNNLRREHLHHRFYHTTQQLVHRPVKSHPPERKPVHLEQQLMVYHIDPTSRHNIRLQILPCRNRRHYPMGIRFKQEFHSHNKWMCNYNYHQHDMAIN